MKMDTMLIILDNIYICMTFLL